MDNFRHIQDISQLDSIGGNLVRTLTERGLVFLFSYSPSIRSLVSWSNNAPQVLGVQDVAITREGNLFLRHVHPDDRFLILTQLEEALQGKIDYRATYRWIRPDTNQIRWLHCRASLLSKENTATLFEGMILDLSSEFTGSINALAGPDSLALVLAALPIMVFTLDRDLRLLRINRPKDNIAINFGDPNFAFEQFKIGKPFTHAFKDPSQRKQYENILHQIIEQKLSHHRTRLLAEERVYNLELLPLQESGTIEGVLCVLTDITETVELEKRLSELQRTEGLRLLASGVSHHFNNSLQSIIGQATVIHTHPEKLELVKQASGAIIDIVNKTAELSKELFAFEDSQRTSFTHLDINLTTMAAINKVEDLFSSGLKIEVSFGNPSPVLAKQQELVLALEAILRNAKEAISVDSKKKGILSISTYEVSMQEGEVGDLKAGTYAKISITDTGSGMSGETLRRCFEPFFTTKEKEPRSGIALSGAGLGLSRAYAIIREFGGGLYIESSLGFGSSIAVFLPVADEPQEVLETTSFIKLETTTSPHILIVDDDIMVLKTICAMLEDLGYPCLGAESGNRAITHMRNYRHSIRLVLLDALMPGVDGATLLKRLKRIRENLLVIGFSGASPEHTKPLLEAGALQIIRKPVDPKTLKEAVQAILQSKQAA